MTRARYAAGMLYLVPHGGLVDRTRLIMIKGLLSVVALIATTTAPDLHVLPAASLAVGVLGSIPQD